MAVFLWSAFGTSATAEELRDCETCPVLVTQTGGTFERSLSAASQSQLVSVGPFAIGKHEVTIAEFAAFVEDTGYEIEPGCRIYTASGGRLEPDFDWRQPRFALPDNGPALCVSWIDANAYVDWLSDRTGEPYRLPSEAEWAFVARDGNANDASYFFRAGLSNNEANCQDCTGFDVMGREDLLSAGPVGSYPANGLGVHDIFGNAAEWLADCYHATFEGAPADGSAWVEEDCTERVVRGGAWYSLWSELAPSRPGMDPTTRDNGIGFRVARDLTE